MDDTTALRSLERWLIQQQEEASAKEQEFRVLNPTASRNHYIRSKVLAEVWGEVNRRLVAAQEESDEDYEIREEHVPRASSD